MVPGPRRNSYERTTYSSIHFWVLIWLTYLFVQNVPCMFHPNPAETWLRLPSAQTMQELDSLHDLLDFSHSPLPEPHPASRIDTRPPPGSHDLSDILNVANIPWPESHPDPRSTISIDNVHPLPEPGYLHNNNIFDLPRSPQLESHPIVTATDTHATRVQKKRPSDKNQLETPARKKKKPSSVETALAFEIINSERPIEEERQGGTVDNMHPLPVSGHLLNNNVLDFANPPQLESSPILTATNMHPMSVQKQRPKGQKNSKL
ncbi:hypothetical protein PTTG_04224 [Puccinia triticina 1-1 BBBD Race 1]|uniref:Uncharacterized protein n=2 Tax=Puccinia triticina TaxID=208348 RepID=A0A180GA46_PUCT1|nr:uncharacterized protein PtA15_1A257 [Puccinia triticina]OAV89575.1 hypothetical protein PTTG_04224 [Puccinia triticina 1-1 BBBD Race 1]WAQ80919.1 hypothetical protein PtA15_1A257 [Puccinia triticina]WAR51813.1 hypothetical protein PtB15_1B249 [Puccinia triticina]